MTFRFQLLVIMGHKHPKLSIKDKSVSSFSRRESVYVSDKLILER